MTTRPTTDGDTKALQEAIRKALIIGGGGDTLTAIEALDLITTRISEQEVELERLARHFQFEWGPRAAAHRRDGRNYQADSVERCLRELLSALTPTTQDQSEGT